MTGCASHLRSVPISDVRFSTGSARACSSDQLNAAAVARRRMHGAELRWFPDLRLRTTADVMPVSSGWIANTSTD